MSDSAGYVTPNYIIVGYFTGAILTFWLTEGRMKKFQNPRTTPSRRKVTGSEREKEEERKNAVKRGHYILPAKPKGSACTSLKPTIT